MVRESAEAGFNVYSPRHANDLAEVRQVTQWCAQYGILHLPWMRGTLSASLDDANADGKRMVWASGLEDERSSRCGAPTPTSSGPGPTG